MSDDERRYWKDPAAREPRGEEHRDEFAAVSWPTLSASRRSFLKAAGFTFAGAWTVGCQRAPVEQAIPFLIHPDEMTPGRAYSYASTCAGCSAGCGLLVKTRDGRPVKLEGNPDHPLSEGGLCAAGQASILGLYDSQRLTAPLRQGQTASWPDVDRELLAHFDEVRRRGGSVRLLTGTITSPTTRALMARFLSTFADARHVMYDPLSSSAILDAHQATHGVRVLPRFHVARAQVIVGIDADFLGTWLSPVEFTRAYAGVRRVGPGQTSMAYHAQLESRLSVTGSKADRRLRLAPGEIGLALTHLAARIASRAGVPFSADGLDPAPVSSDALDDLATRLWDARGRSLVICGTQDFGEQLLCNFVNELLGNYGTTVDVVHPSYQRQGNDADLVTLRQEIARGRIAALIVAGVNPLYELPDADLLSKDLSNVPLVVSLAERIDETSNLAHYVCPDHHCLESWTDAEPVAGVVSLTQPAIHAIGATRSILETLSVWSGRPQPALEILRAYWTQAIFPRASGVGSFDTFWDQAVERGVVEVSTTPVAVRAFDRAAVHPVARATRPASSELALVLYPKVAMLDGRHAHNAWLHELPDPISKVTWDNYACVSPSTAAGLGIANGDLVRLDAAEQGRVRSIELPAFVQPGQHDRVVAVALGYGRKGTERFAHVGPQWLEARPTGSGNGVVGQNAAPFVRVADGRLQYVTSVQLVKTGRSRQLASTQDHHSLMPPEKLTSAGVGPRPIVQELTLGALLAQRGREPEHARDAEEARGRELWPADHPYGGHRWALAIDLSACTGCSACVAACQVENNVPVVGQDEVRRHREMHWIRIDRYYAGDGADLDVVHQPMLCQHCENAPCETVCPVLATVHSDEGLNEQVYNRCIGTRYCANNCPYKVRRFNWFTYPHDDRLQNLVLNPDVTVRSRGVMEKCSLCVQRIQEARMEARREGRAIAEGDIQTACQQTCPAQAIVFGDVNDPKSRVAQLVAGTRAFRVLEELNVRPSVTYLKVVRNRPERAGGPHA